ncbi:hypothetical protein DZC78_15620 [Olleya aquimaris]|uniref:Uncharacterized protein n=1 Tax=Olleya sediminilitoris TaxID=2795739 RepID=A0ABS1WL67_9FLAO|nr:MULTISPECIES: hypothetical protein [Olleya]AXO81749.1 hypothetical protein DZC78_15620 [Olleya aquimaris]MBL7559872.1 hypothetical protein [Olleya sediminilitoris]
MKAKQTYLKGKSVFIVSLIVITITALTVYLTGINYNRSVTLNLYLSLSIIGTVLILFMTYGLYTGVKLKDNYPKIKTLKSGDYISSAGSFPDIQVPTIDTEDVIIGIVVSFLFWIVTSVLLFLFLILIEAIFWFSIFILLAMLYWVFFRALKLVFSKSKTTKNNLGLSLMYATFYTTLYLSWIFLIAYFSQKF